MISIRTALLVALVGPAAALVSLPGGTVIRPASTTPETAQQFGVLIIIPLTAVFVAQFMGGSVVGDRDGFLGLGLFGAWMLHASSA